MDAAQKLLDVIVRRAREGPLRSKAPGVSTMPEVHESCGLDVDQMYSLLGVLQDAKLIRIEGEYPFEEIKLIDSDLSSPPADRESPAPD